MKRIITAIIALGAALAVFTGCNDTAERTLYSGPEYVMFQDTLAEFYVSAKKNTISVPVSSLKAVDYDRTFSVEVVGKGSTAIEDHHFSLKDHNLTIKAGQLVTNLQIDVDTEAFGNKDSLGTTLRLVLPEALKWDLYATETKVSLEKYCDFDIKPWLENEKRESDPEKYNYANYIFYATFPFTQSADQFAQALIKVMEDPNDDHRLILKGPFQKGRDLKIRFAEGDPEQSTITMLAQESFFAENTLWVNMRTNDLSPSYYDTCNRYMELYLESYVDNYVPFGVYPYYLQWISQARADEIQNNGF